MNKREKKIEYLDMALICPNPDQPRKTFLEAPLQELMTSVKRHGILQPILVKAVAGKYQIISGERRYIAAKRLGMEKAPAIIENIGDREALEIAIIENLHREDLNPYEKASSFRELMDICGFTQEKLANMLGLSRSAVANTLRLLDLPESAVELLKAGGLTEGHSRAILSCKNHKDRETLLQKIKIESMSVRRAEKAASKLNVQRKLQKRAGREHDENIKHLLDEIRDSLGTKVNLVGSVKKGKIELEYYSEEELEGIIERLLRAEQ